MEHRVHGLDGLRAIAVSLVLLAHSADMRGVPEALTALVGALKFQFVGVRLFFCISGFIITHLLLREECKNGRISLQVFLAAANGAYCSAFAWLSLRDACGCQICAGYRDYCA